MFFLLDQVALFFGEFLSVPILGRVVGLVLFGYALVMCVSAMFGGGGFWLTA